MMLKMVTNTKIKNRIITRLNKRLKNEFPPSYFESKISNYIYLII